MAANLHRTAIVNAQEVHLARWDEVMIPDIENLIDWIKLFMVRDFMLLSVSMLSSALTQPPACAEHQSQTFLLPGELYNGFHRRVGQLCWLRRALLRDQQGKRQIPIVHSRVGQSCWLCCGAESRFWPSDQHVLCRTASYHCRLAGQRSRSFHISSVAT
jgi:hypothetical protein